MIRRVCFSITLCVSASLLSPPVHADDGNTEPTPVGFPARTCTLELDRSREEAVTFRPTLPFEDTNLAAQSPEVMQRLLHEWEAWSAGARADCEAAQKKYPPIKGLKHITKGHK